MHKPVNERANEILAILADGQFHSGEALGEQLGVSRAAINQNIQKLAELGLDIFSVTGKGYRLSDPVELLDEAVIRQQSKAESNLIQVRSVVGSSNDEVRKLAAEQPLASGYALFAEAQTAGRGRRGKQWHSPFGSNLYISLHWPIAEGINRAMGLSLVVGIGVAHALAELGISGVGVKWPNDVYVNQQKIAGILVDIDSCADGSVNCTIGMGINVRMPAAVADQIDQRWTDIAQNLSVQPSRNAIAGRIYRSVLNVLERFSEQGLAAFQSEWRKLDVFYEQPVVLLMGERRVRGICKGIDENGAILIENGDKLTRYFGGELSLRAADASY